MMLANDLLPVRHLDIASGMIIGHKLVKFESAPMTISIITRLPTDTAAIVDLLKARESIVDRLRQNPDFQALQRLDDAIRELRAPLQAQKEEAEEEEEEEEQTDATTEGNGADARPRRKREKGVLTGYSQADGVEVLLKHFNRPMTIGELVGALEKNGVAVGGTKKNINLSSTLSRDGRFSSVRYEGRPCWWLQDKALPENNAAGDQPAA
jgi:hypothetical protein